jgi:superoxide dismutase, Cu-Zn family
VRAEVRTCLKSKNPWILVSLALVAAFFGVSRAGADHLIRRAVLHDAGGNVVGRVVFETVTTGVRVTATVSALAPGFHGFHIHANNDPANGVGCVAPTFASADGHFNTSGNTHGGHAGDMPSLLAKGNGVARLSFTTDRFTLDAVAGRAVIVHANADNYGNVPTGGNPDQYTPNSPAATALTEATGNAGARVACGVIGD